MIQSNPGSSESTQKPTLGQVNPGRRYLGLLFMMGGLGVLLTLIATRWGAALRDDSYYYIQPAREILAGNPSFFHPHYPPFLPLVLTAIGPFGIDPLDGIRYLNAALFGMNIVLCGVILYRMTRAPGFALLGALLVLISPVIFEVHLWGMSEPLYFTLTLLAFYGLGRYFDSPARKWLLFSGAMAGLAFWTRYAGIALLGAGLLGLLLNPRLKWIRRMLDCAVYGAAGSLPIILYALRNAAVTGQPVNYQGFEWAPLAGKELAEALYTGLLWFMPGRLARGREELAALALVGAFLAAAIAYALLDRPSFRTVLANLRGTPLFFLPLLFMATNFGVLYAAHYAVAYKSPFDLRLTSPIHLGMLLTLAVLAAWIGRSGAWFSKTALALALALLVLLYSPRTFETLRSFYETGSGFATRYWRESETIAYIKQHPDATVISTAPFGVYFWANRTTEVVSAHSTGAALQRYLRQTGGILVVFDTMPLEMYGIDVTDYLMGLEKLIELNDSTIYKLK